MIDSINKKPISDATLSINQNRYYATNSAGSILINNEQLKPGDTLIFSHIGYTSKIFVFSKPSSLPTILELVTDNNQLLEVNIVAKKNIKLLNIGNTHTAYFTGYMTDFNSKYALFVPWDTSYAGVFKTIQLKISDRGKGQRMPLKINIFTKSISGIPGTALINDDIIVSNPEGKVNLVVDIRKYNLQVPTTGFFIIAETLSEGYYEKGFVKSQFGVLRNKLPALFWTQKKKNSESYSMYQLGFDLKKQWIIFFASNFCFSAKVQVNN